MFCAYCGKPLVRDSSFCAFCGKPVGQNSASGISPSVEWEYAYYRLLWEGDTGKWYSLYSQTEHDVRLDAWGRDQSWIMPDIQKWLDEGWKPLNAIGPGAYHFVDPKWNERRVKQFLVKLRRPATPLPEPVKKLLGTWQQSKDSQMGIGLNLKSPMRVRQQATIEFMKDRTFSWKNRYDEKANGVYRYSATQDVFDIWFETPAHYLGGKSEGDYQARLDGNILQFIVDRNNRASFQRLR